ALRRLRERLLAAEVARVEPDHLVERHVVRARLVLEIVVADEDQSRLDAERLDTGEAVRHGARPRQRGPQRGRVAGRTEDLVAELARIAGAGQPGRHAADLRLLGEEAEVAKLAQVGV